MNSIKGKRIKKILVRTLIVLSVLYLVLLIPDSDKFVIPSAQQKPFAWNQDSMWIRLENKFQYARTLKPEILEDEVLKQTTIAEFQLAFLSKKDFLPGDSLLYELRTNFFSLAPLIAAQPKKSDWFITYYNRVRALVKTQSTHWDIEFPGTRNILYETLYGMRAAVEEILLQSKPSDFSPLMFVKDEPSETPSASVLGITVHSGDIFVSRGGAEVSAFISRGNDYPGNFSHVALFYVDEKTKTPYLIEAHIEKGVAVSTVDQYIKDKKLRFMVLRPRLNQRYFFEDPLLPQKAAHYMYETAQTKHIPYDFKMNFRDSSAMFCSEVASFAYAHFDIQLWQARSTISSPGVVNWLHTFGVENFVTEMPSDLEYDPRLSVVAEWRDPETLLKDHIDNAVMDAMLESANKGKEIDYNLWKLPIARVVKGYSMLLNFFGKPGIIPEGMSATQGLKNNSFVEEHVAVKAKTEIAVEKFTKQNGYVPPYWQLVQLAEKAME